MGQDPYSNIDLLWEREGLAKEEEHPGSPVPIGTRLTCDSQLIGRDRCQLPDLIGGGGGNRTRVRCTGFALLSATG